MIVTKRGSGSGGRGSVGRAGGRRAGKLRERPYGGQTDGIAAYGKIVWTRRPMLASSLAEVLMARPGQGAGFRQATETRQRTTPG